MKSKKFSQRLIEAEKILGVTPDELSFILGIKYEMFRRYRNGEWDDTYSKRKDGFYSQLDNIDIEIESKIGILKRALRNYQKNSVKKNVKLNHSNHRNLKIKGDNY